MISDVVGFSIPRVPNVIVLNYDSSLSLNGYQKNKLHCALTAAKKLILMR